ncbi:hypothetical protein [Rossellomorea vietnamensis]|uniref:hypothetical protein n=1 Tax=Rossellomorea vietnamensis TaxID=218284 RepID=UPI003CF4CC75
MMFKKIVITVHVFIFLVATIIGLGAVFNISAPDPNRTHEVWFTAIAIYNILVLISMYAQLKLKKGWIFLITVLGLIALFVLLPEIVLYIEGILN